MKRWTAIPIDELRNVSDIVARVPGEVETDDWLVITNDRKTLGTPQEDAELIAKLPQTEALLRESVKVMEKAWEYLWETMEPETGSALWTHMADMLMVSDRARALLLEDK